MRRRCLLAVLLSVLVVTVGAAGPPPGPDGAAYQVYDISLHEPERLLELLRRLDAAASGPQPVDAVPAVALVLHGPEVAFFARDNYSRYREIVDRAAKLDAFRVIEVKVCETRMRSLGLDGEQMPAFVEPVPYGPGEVERLVGEGWVRM